MAIRKVSKNLIIEIRSNFISNCKIFEETAEKTEIVAIAENLILASNKKVIATSKKSNND